MSNVNHELDEPCPRRAKLAEAARGEGGLLERSILERSLDSTDVV